MPAFADLVFPSNNQFSFSVCLLPLPTCFTHHPKTTLVTVDACVQKGKCCILIERKILVQHVHSVYYVCILCVVYVFVCVYLLFINKY